MDESIKQSLIGLWNAVVRGDVVGRDKIAARFRDIVVHIHQETPDATRRAALHEELTHEMIKTLSEQFAESQSQIGELRASLRACQAQNRRLQGTIKGLLIAVHNATQDEEET